MNTKISVVVPVYNTKKYLKDSINSIIDQKDYLHEIIIVNDGSTDGSGELIDKLYSKLDFIKIFHTPNQRQGPARNLGTRESTGDFIYYFDSDDILLPDFFKSTTELILSNPDLDIFCFSAEPFIDEEYMLSVEEREKILSTKVYSRKVNALCNTGEEAFNLLFPQKSFSPLPYLYIFRKSLVIDNNIEFRSIRFEDEEFVYQLFLQAKKTVIQDTNFCKRRIREGSTMELDRCFADMLGYAETIETLNRLLDKPKLKDETKNNLKRKTYNLSRAIIIMKVASNIKLSNSEKDTYNQKIKPLFKNDSKLYNFSLLYPMEYKLRKFKKNLFG